jgi:hypothetical protein
MIDHETLTFTTKKLTRTIGQFKDRKGPTAVFTAGIHGNEPSGIQALVEVADEIVKDNILLQGNVYMLAGNLQALAQNKRFIREDLNRIWIKERLNQLNTKSQSQLADEDREQMELISELNTIIAENTGPLYFMDLHTTSSSTIPFMTVNDSLLNRKYTKQFPVPTILGIEEYLSGPLLSYINEEGYVAFGFEGGQHQDPKAVTRHKAFVYLSLYQSQIIDLQKDKLTDYINILKPQTPQLISAFEIYHRHKIKRGDHFEMEPGFANFQFLDKDVHIATSNGQRIVTTRKGRIFMPLYQSQGDEGFFAIQRIPGFFLWLSRIIRQSGLHSLFKKLPGISPSDRAGYFVVDRKKARFLTKQLIHLFGYRIVARYPTHYVIHSRETHAKKHLYKNTKWY